jgi:hypothetical protein
MRMGRIIPTDNHTVMYLHSTYFPFLKIWHITWKFRLIIVTVIVIIIIIIIIIIISMPWQHWISQRVFQCYLAVRVDDCCPVFVMAFLLWFYNLKCFYDSQLSQPRRRRNQEESSNPEQKNWKIKFKWTKAHVGIYGNEIADRLAKKATQNHYVTYSRIPRSAIKKDTRKESIRKWQRQWEETKKGAITKEFIPSVERRLAVKWTLIPKVTTITTGHGNIQSYTD